MNTTSTNELETDLLNKLVSENEEAQKQIKICEKRVKENDVVIRALRSKLGVSNPASKTTGYGSKAQMIRQAIQAITKPRFTQRDILDEVKRANPDVAISDERVKSVLWGLQDEAELIKQVRQGNNRGQVAEFEKLASANGGQNGSPAIKDANIRVVGVSANTGVITVGQLEDFIREKNRRMKDVLVRFGVNESAVKRLFHPASKVFQAEKGWIKISE